MVINSLKHIEEFRKVLASYQPSDETRQILRQTHVVLLVGPSSCGKNTIINKLLESGEYRYVVSDTTRQPRVNNGVQEQDGREYWFRSEEDILEDLKAGKFLEAAIIHDQQVSGVSVRELKAATDSNKIAINEIEVVGADHVHALSPEAKFLFVMPPSFDEWMVRMSVRGELPEDEMKRRLESAIEEIVTALDRDFYTFVINDTFAHAARHVDALIHGKTDTPEDQEAARMVAREILDDTQKYLLELG